MINNNRFAIKLQNTYEHVLFYENEQLKEKALEKIPINQLNEYAKKKFDSYIEQMKSNSSNEKHYNLKDFFLLELLSWFKNDFFSWVNEPICEICNSNKNMKFKHQANPESREVLWLAGNVEVYE